MKKYLALMPIIFLVGCVHYEYYVGAPKGMPSSEMAALFHDADIKIRSIDGEPHRIKGIFVNDTHTIYLGPGTHTVVFEYCNCSMSGSTRIDGEFVFTFEYKKGLQYKLGIASVNGKVFNFGLFSGDSSTGVFKEKLIDIPGGTTYFHI